MAASVPKAIPATITIDQNEGLLEKLIAIVAA
jgi:hypothetical protein